MDDPKVLRANARIAQLHQLSDLCLGDWDLAAKFASRRVIDVIDELPYTGGQLVFLFVDGRMRDPKELKFDAGASGWRKHSMLSEFVHGPCDWNADVRRWQ
jgi:hypothetical protein